MFIGTAHAGPMVNVDYIHQLIERQWDIIVPTNPELADVYVAANMKYLLTAIDRANEMLNGYKTTNYGNSKKYATLDAADTIATKNAVSRLIRPKPKFSVTTIPDTRTFVFTISASGTFTIDWGDGNIETITRPIGNYSPRTYGHNYATAGEYIIKFDGQATGYDAEQVGYNGNIFYAAISFANGTPAAIASIDGSLGAIFGTIGDGTTPGQQPNFYQTFKGCVNLTGAIPENLFDGISGAPTAGMFNDTFANCTGLTGSIPENLFADIHGAPTRLMFAGTFLGCSGLSGQIPENLFAGLSGAPTAFLFSGAFQGCTGLTGSIPENLFAGISGAPAEYMFNATFRGCTGLAGEIPENLFGGITSGNAQYMFYHTFAECSGLGKCIPERLFVPANIVIVNPAQAQSLQRSIISQYQPFYGTLIGQASVNCSGYIQPKFFVRTVPNTSRFFFTLSATGTFTIDWGDGNVQTVYNEGYNTYGHSYSNNAYNPTGEYTIGIGGQVSYYSYGESAISFSEGTPEAVAAIDGSLGAVFGTTEYGEQPAFYKTFADCVNLKGEIPEDLFSGIYGQPVEYMFAYTFDGCSGLTGEIPQNLFSGIKGAPAADMFAGTFLNCIGLTGCIPDKLFAGIDAPLDTIIADNDPFNGTSLQPLSCSEAASKFFVTTTPNTSSFYFYMSAAGTFTIDWGDGKTEMITKSNTSSKSVSHTYATPGEYTIGIGGRAAKYYPTFTTTLSLGAPISFASQTKLAAIDGSLGAVFPTIGDGTGTGQQPRFTNMFNGCSNLSGNIPQNLFHGVHGQPVDGMFYQTFRGTKLTGSIPETLFAGVKGKPVKELFLATFYESPNLTGAIPEKLFANIAGEPADTMFHATFYGCSGLNGSIPEDLFIGIKGAPVYSSFSAIFKGCSSLTGPIPEKLFAGLSGAPAQRMFRETFDGCSGLTGTIPEKLFAGISGAPADMMFDGTFAGCSKLEGKIPAKLFAKISGAPAEFMYKRTFENCSGLTDAIPDRLFGTFSGAPKKWMFQDTFKNCTGLTGPLPANLFRGITGDAANGMFATTFYGCSGLTGAIPENMFGDLSGTPADYMFSNTFEGCSNLTSIPANLFGNISGTITDYTNPFTKTFAGCTKLSGQSAKIGGKYLYEIWPGATAQFSGCYTGDTGLGDYANIPTAWK